MVTLSTAFLVCYFLILLLPSIFGLHRYYLIFLYYHHQRMKRGPQPKFDDLKTVPMVTIQLPIYNELYVAPRLIRSICAFDYPRDRMEIQVLDDSTDETVPIVARVVAEYQAQGFRITQIRRQNRVGFKAGALAEGLKQASGEFVAIFDADFMPQPDFLKKVIPHFSRGKKVGMVQTRWGHLNRDYSLLTQAQAVLLDGHFVIEHTARHKSGCFFNFNGTAGVWRKSCIETAGGWSGDTLTEDIDLSYRAQMVGWDFIYLDDVVVDAELPVDMNALKTQQHRWAKGSVQVARKLLPRLLRGPYPLRVKIESFFHLVANFNYLFIVLLSFLLPIAVYVRQGQGWYQFLWIDLPLFLAATWSVSVFYYHSQRRVQEGFFRRLKYIPISLAVGIGLCVNNSRAVLEGLMNNAGEFKRTPKYAVVGKKDSWKEKGYRGRLNVTSVIEIILTVHFGIACFYVISQGLILSLPFVLLFEIGFFYTGVLSLLQSRWISRILPESATSAVLDG